MILPHLNLGNKKLGLIETSTYTATGNGSYTVKAGTTHLQVEMWGGGGGGGRGETVTTKGGYTCYGGGGGGSGAYTYVVLTEDFKKGDTVNFTVGSGGGGGNSQNPFLPVDPTAGSNTTLNTYVRNKTTLVTYSSVYAGGGGAGGKKGTAGAAGVTSGGISGFGFSTSGNAGGAGEGAISNDCSDGGSGATAPFISYSTPVGNDGGNCANDTEGGSPTYVGFGGGGAYANEEMNDSAGIGGDGENGKVVIKAWGYYPPDPNAV